MYMVEALDAGDMLSKVVVPIEERDTVGLLHDKLAAAGSALLMETIPQLFAGSIEAQPQNHDEATFAPNIKRADERIDWTRTAEQIYNQVRGLNPWPVAFTSYQGKVWKLWWVEKLVGKAAGNEPGTIVAREEDGLVVACGDGAVKITELQPEGKKRMSALDFLRGAGANIEIGTKVGE